jgi:hypothetical protein
MADAEHYDLVLLGSGEAGKYLAWTLAAEGNWAAIVERKYVGGFWPNAQRSKPGTPAAARFARPTRNNVLPAAVAVPLPEYSGAIRRTGEPESPGC